MLNKKAINWQKTLMIAGVVGLALVVEPSFAADEKGIAKIASNITGSFSSIGQLMIAVAYVSGIGFAIASIFKFKQHKDNPTQIPLGTPIALLAIAIALVFLPAFFKPLGTTLTGEDSGGTAGGFTGEGALKIPGGDGGGGQ